MPHAASSMQSCELPAYIRHGLERAGNEPEACHLGYGSSQIGRLAQR
jgi:hypothetical protein